MISKCTNNYEAIVVGSGATGGVAALTLAEAGVKVLVIEAGPFYSPEKAMGSEPLNTIKRITNIISGEHKVQVQHPGYWKANPELFVNEKENPYTTPLNKPFLWTQGRQVGGRSLTWGGITLRLSDNEFKASKKDGYGPEWPIRYSDLEQHYSSLERRLRIHGNKDGLDGLPDGEFIKPLPFTESEIEFSLKIDSKLGLKIIHSRGFGPHKHANSPSWPKSSSTGSTLKAAVKTGNVEIISNHIVEKIVMNRSVDRAEGLIVLNKNNGSRVRFNSNLIVLCSSTIQTLKILLNSEESQSEKGFIDSSGSLGCNLMDHISTCRFFTYKNSKANADNKNRLDNALSGAGSFLIPFGVSNVNRSSSEYIRGYGIWGAIDRFDPPKIFKRLPNTSTGFLIGHGEVLPNKENKVTLSSSLDKWGMPIPHINFKWGKNDLSMARDIQKTINEIVDAAGGKILPLKDIYKMPFFEPIINNAFALRDAPPPPGYYIHEVGGAPMGLNAETSVVDKWNRVWGCTNLLVVDGACWPTSGWQSPTLTMMAITRRACLKAIQSQNE